MKPTLPLVYALSLCLPAMLAIYIGDAAAKHISTHFELIQAVLR